MKQWQTDAIAILSGLLALALLIYVPTTLALVIRLARPFCDPDVVKGLPKIVQRSRELVHET